MIKKFDIAPRKYETLTFEIFGKTYELEKKIPAGVALLMSEHEPSAEVPMNTLLALSRMIFGNKILDDLSKNPDFTIDVLGELLLWGLAAIQE